jgi:hypothetical protein
MTFSIETLSRKLLFVTLSMNSTRAFNITTLCR